MNIEDEYIQKKYGYNPRLVKQYGQAAVYKACLELQKNKDIPLLTKSVKQILEKHK